MSIDLATGRRVAIVRRTLEPLDAVAWADTLERLSALWHPGLAPCVDFGFGRAHEWFEAYGVESSPVAATGVEAFIRTHDVACSLAHLDLHRHVTGLVPASLDPRPGQHAAEQPPVQAIGLRLAPRGLEGHLLAALDGLGGVGPHLWSIDAPAGSGWSTSWRRLARQARLRGFVPIDANVLESSLRRGDGRTTTWLSLLGGSALLVRHERGEWTLRDRQQLARLLVRLGGVDAPRIVVLDVMRGARPQPAAHALAPIAPETLAGALWVAPGSCSSQWLRARSLASACGGWPGPFVARVAARLGLLSTVPTVHERAPAFASHLEATGEGAADDPMVTRVAALAAAGRLAAAERRALAAARASIRRGDQSAAARRLEATAHAAAARGAVPRSRGLWREAAARVPARAVSHLLGPAADVAEQWLRQAALCGTERLLEALVAAGVVLGQPPARAAGLLASCLCWQGRWAEAAECAREHELPAASVWPLLERNDVAGAAAVLSVDRPSIRERADDVDAARLRLAVAMGSLDQLCVAATAAAATRGDGALSLAADDMRLLPAEGLISRGVALDEATCRRLRAMTRADAPRLARARARLVLALSAVAPDGRQALVHEVGRVARGTGLAALAFGASKLSPWPAAAGEGGVAMLEDLVAVVRVCQADEDPRAALARVCALLHARLRPTAIIVSAVVDSKMATMAGLGRHELSELVSRVSATGQTIAVADDNAADCGVAVRLGDSVVGVVACHWAMPRPAALAEGRALLEAAAAAVAPTVRLAAELTRRPTPGSDGSSLLGASRAIAAVRAAVDAAARVPFTVLIDGESGCGKELVAREIHRLGPRRQRSFCAVNCAALTDELCEAELFGHARGAFTGAVAERAGLFEDADGGTLFLDEVGELSPRAQAKLLRAIQEGEIRRLGETRPRRVDVRLIAATNRPLADAVAAGAFRADLRYRLDVIHITVPPLRERPDDVPLLAQHFWARVVERAGGQGRLSSETLAALARYDWPGNVRELQNVMAALSVHAPRRGLVPPSALPAALRGGHPGGGVTLEEARRRADEHIVRAALAQAGGHRGRAARSLGVSRQGLAKLVDRLRIDRASIPVDR